LPSYGIWLELPTDTLGEEHKIDSFFDKRFGKLILTVKDHQAGDPLLIHVEASP
jgi:hypothetical protein